MTKTMCVVLLVCGLSVLPAMGTLSLEATYDSNADLTLGTPATGTLVGNASVSGGKLQVPQTVGGPITGVNYGDALNWFNMTNSASWGTNTIASIFTLDTRTQVGGAQALAAVAWRNHWDGNQLWSADNGINFLACEGAGMPQISLATSSNVASLRCNMYDASLQTGVEYFAAASWRDNGDNTVDLTIYVRPTSDLTGSNAFYSSGTVANPGTPIRLNVSQFVVGYAPYGARTNGTLGGGINLMQVYAGDFQADRPAYNTLFANAVPEPATMILMLTGLAGLLRRRS